MRSRSLGIEETSKNNGKYVEELGLVPGLFSLRFRIPCPPKLSLSDGSPLRMAERYGKIRQRRGFRPDVVPGCKRLCSPISPRLGASRRQMHIDAYPLCEVPGLTSGLRRGVSALALTQRQS